MYIGANFYHAEKCVGVILCENERGWIKRCNLLKRPIFIKEVICIRYLVFNASIYI